MGTRFEQDLIVGPVEGYKMVNDDLTCRGFKFEIGKRMKLPNNDPLELCKNGFHFCRYPSGVWSYYDKGRMFKVKAYGVLVPPVTPGTEYKLVCEEIVLYEEIVVDGDCNTGKGNTGNWNTGNCNTGKCNTGDRNTGDWNTGDCNTRNCNTGNCNTGNGNTGDRNTGDGNTGDRNTGNCNTGKCNTGNGNCGDWFSGSLNFGDAPIYLFNKITKVKKDDLPWSLINKLSYKLMGDEPIDPTPFLAIPNATKVAIKRLHQAHINARKEAKND